MMFSLGSQALYKIFSWANLLLSLIHARCDLIINLIENYSGFLIYTMNYFPLKDKMRWALSRNKRKEGLEGGNLLIISRT